jgi:hypothetical protein
VTRQPRRNHSPAFQSERAARRRQRRRDAGGLSQRCDVHANQLKQLNDPILEGATGVFGEVMAERADASVNAKTLPVGCALGKAPLL